MAETATQFMTSITANLNENPEENLQTLLYKLTIVYKCYGKRLNQNDKNIVCEAFETFANRGIMKGTFIWELFRRQETVHLACAVSPCKKILSNAI